MINVKNLKNTLSLKGVVDGYKIEAVDSVMRWDDAKNGLKVGDAVVQYKGYITVRTGVNQFASVNIQRNQSFRNGELDPTSQALEAMSKQEVQTYGKTHDFAKTPTIRIYGGASLVDNYYVKDQEVHGGIRADLGFGYVTLGDPVDEPEFENLLNVSVLVKDIVPEVVKDEETGRAVVKAIFPYTYGSEKKGTLVVRATTLEFVAGEYEDEQGKYDLGTELLDYGDEVLDYSWVLIGELNGYLEEQKDIAPADGEKRRGFGKRAIIDTKPKRHTEFLLTGLDILDNGEAFSDEDIRDAIQAREKDIAEKMKADEEKANRQQQEETQRGRGSFGQGRAAAVSQPQETSSGRPAGRSGRPSRNF